MRFTINLSGLILCPNQVIYDLLEQLGGVCEKSYDLLFQPVCELNTISDWVYLDDSFGDPAAHRAYTLQEQLILTLEEKNISALELDVYLGDLLLTHDNVYSLLLLSESLQSLKINLYISPPNINALQTCLTMFLTEQYKNISVHYHHIKLFLNTCTLKEQAKILELKQKQLLIKKGFGFSELTQENIEEVQGQLINYAWSCLKSGAAELGCRVLETAVSYLNADSCFRDQYMMQLIIIRFLAHRHNLVVDEFIEEQFNYLNASQIEHLYFIKAFSATLVRRHKEAAVWYESAKISAITTLQDENSLYKLNLYALFLFLNGDIEEAFRLEVQLLKHLEREQPEARIVKHVILMNIARLYKKEKHYEDAEEFYGQAYQQLQGERFTLFDAMNQEIDKAILFEARGLLFDALSCWINVRVSWLSCPRPLSMPPRTRLVLCQERMIDTIVPLSREKVNDFLLNKLNQLYVLTADMEKKHQD